MITAVVYTFIKCWTIKIYLPNVAKVAQISISFVWRLWQDELVVYYPPYASTSA